MVSSVHEVADHNAKRISLERENVRFPNCIDEWGLYQDHLIKTHQQVLFLASGRFSHITPAVYELHWPPVSLRIDYKILLLTFKCIIYGLAKTYLSDLISTIEFIIYSLRSILVYLAGALYICSILTDKAINSN